MNVMRSISKEYGEPFADVVRVMAEQGNSRVLVAATLGVNLSYFRQLCKRFNLHRHFKPQREMSRYCKGGGNGWIKGKPRLDIRSPIVHNGATWYPGEPTHHYLFQRRKHGAAVK